ncbi:hypothetical protein [Arsenophonus endosymbiont of Aleurodicus floccissimus]|uniref:hypothetical protein n=1 Tax=Arsenophonus endosymbiont of Aleurodicus floccissimus TaxID=2152761 RepID=UPI000E6AEA98|nr:hypothetical protein [Arsenophonus endosymbiont of Aleurodicus floccissimus]
MALKNRFKYTSAFLRSGLVVGTLCSGGAVTTATLDVLSRTFSATKLVSNSVDAFTSRSASVALDNAVEKKIAYRNNKCSSKGSAN